MIDKQLRAYNTYRNFLRILLVICGCWYMPTKSGKSTYYWSLFVLMLMIMYAMMSLHMSFILRHNLGNIMKSIGLTISAISTILKMISFMINRKSLINYHRTVNDLFEEELRQNEKIRMLIFSHLRRMYILAKGFGHLWTVPDNFLYHLHLLFETSLIVFSSFTACGVDSVFGFFVYQFASTMRAMTFRLTNPLSTEKFSDLLRMCVAKHQKLLRCRDTLEHVYAPIILWHIVTNAVLLCALIYDVMPVRGFINAKIDI
ncbi:PREDICTED: uncharacterized protein LOC105457423 [Wasmannia auropunctata]|uniref:uncharacterized protein LOC105457423 n=1 Tax=Wasmannia auropunctata TaxID=64793 RepID=UPI0005EFBA29|nr:PREDICTED: uncharacterized protein LOC105457423 [Wasmannia auropunctata]